MCILRTSIMYYCHSNDNIPDLNGCSTLIKRSIIINHIFQIFTASAAFSFTTISDNFPEIRIRKQLSTDVWIPGNRTTPNSDSSKIVPGRLIPGTIRFANLAFVRQTVSALNLQSDGRTTQELRSGKELIAGREPQSSGYG